MVLANNETGSNGTTYDHVITLRCMLGYWFSQDVYERNITCGYVSQSPLMAGWRNLTECTGKNMG